MGKAKQKGGRPKSPLDLPPGWDAEVIEMYDQGASDVEVKAHIYNLRGSFSNDLWDRWMDEEAKFSETIKRGRMLSQAWWERQGRINLATKDFSAALWYMNMKNRFKWSDKTEIDHTTQGQPIKAVINFYDPNAGHGDQ